MDEREANISALMQVPGMARNSAEAFVDKGYTSVEEVAYVPQAELVAELGFSKAELQVIRSSALGFLLRLK